MTIIFLNENNHVMFEISHFRTLNRCEEKFVVETTDGDIYNVWKNSHIKEIKVLID